MSSASGSGRKRALGAVFGALVLVGLIVSLASFRSIEPGEVAVRLNRLTGAEQVIDKPGIVMRLPLIHDLYLIDASPQTLYLEGDQLSQDLRVLPRLTVRANDGSNFWFERLTIQYQIIPDEAITVLHERGPGDAYREWLLPTVRSILRDEFGRQSTRDVSNPATYQNATADAATELNAALNPHGIRIISVDTPEPRFNASYESTIEARNQANNQIRVIDEELLRAETERGRRLAQLSQTRNMDYQRSLARLEGELRQALVNRQQAVAEAESALLQAEGRALSELDSANARADELRVQIEAEIAQVQAQITALQANGVEAIMRQLAQNLEHVEIDVQPYQSDPNPQRVRVEGIGGLQ